jgi:hypothetical protein
MLAASPFLKDFNLRLINVAWISSANHPDLKSEGHLIQDCFFQTETSTTPLPAQQHQTFQIQKH